MHFFVPITRSIRKLLTDIGNKKFVAFERASKDILQLFHILLDSWNVLNGNSELSTSWIWHGGYACYVRSRVTQNFLSWYLASNQYKTEIGLLCYFKFRISWLVILSHKNSRAGARALIVGGGGGGIFIYSCYVRLISFEINLKTTDFKRRA